MKNFGDKDWDEFHDPEIIDWKRVRESIAHENTLTNYRLVWFLLSQGLLFTAFTSVYQTEIKNDAILVTEDIKLIVLIFIRVIPIIGFLICIYLSIHLYTGYAQHYELYKWWNKNYGENNPRHPSICGGRGLTARILAIYTFPVIFAAGWSLIFFRDELKCLLLYLGFTL